MKTKKPNLLELSIGTPICYYQRQRLPCSLFSAGNKFQASLPEFIIFKIKKVFRFELSNYNNNKIDEMKQSCGFGGLYGRCRESSSKKRKPRTKCPRRKTTRPLFSNTRRDQVTEGVSCKLTENTDR